MIIYDINWAAKTAGPSPYNNERTELFLFGCKKACQGKPCPGCFNSELWDSSSATITYNVNDVANNIMKFSPNKYVSIGGGEPTDQFFELIELCRILHENGYHILVYTWKDIHSIMLNKKHKDHNNFKRLVRYCDIIVDGEYDETQRKYKEDAKDGFFNSIGSGNQKIWSITNDSMIGYRMKSIKNIYLDKNNILHYSLRDDIAVSQNKIKLVKRKV